MKFVADCYCFFLHVIDGTYAFISVKNNHYLLKDIYLHHIDTPGLHTNSIFLLVRHVPVGPVDTQFFNFLLVRT